MREVSETIEILMLAFRGGSESGLSRRIEAGMASSMSASSVGAPTAWSICVAFVRATVRCGGAQTSRWRRVSSLRAGQRFVLRAVQQGMSLACGSDTRTFTIQVSCGLAFTVSG